MWWLIPMVALGAVRVEVSKQVLPVFPAEAQALGMTEADCQLMVTIDSAGVPTAVEPRDCPTVLLNSAVTTTFAWRWEPPVTSEGEAVDSTTFPHVLHFDLPKDRAYPVLDARLLAELQGAHDRTPVIGEGCIVGARMRADRSIDQLASNDPDQCLAIPNTGAAFPLRARLGTVTCHVDFVAVRGQARELTISWCPKVATQPIDRLVRTWQWYSIGEDPVPYHVELTFEP